MIGATPWIRPKGGVAVEDVDGDLSSAGADLFRLGEDVGGVNTGGTCTNNGDAQGRAASNTKIFLSKFTVRRPVRREQAVSLVFTSAYFTGD